MTTLFTLLLLTLATFSLSTLHAAPAPAPVCPLAGSSIASLEHVGNDPTAYELAFRWNRHDIPVDYADFHYRINDGEFINVRAYDGSTPATEAIHAVTLHPGDVLHAMVTYSTNGVGCDVAISEHRTSTPAAASTASTSTHATAATPVSCNNIQQNVVHDGAAYNIHTTKPEEAQFVDAHYHVAGSDPVNIRMVPSSHTRGVYELPTPIHGDASRITYYLTFSTGSMQCDTPTFATGIPEEPAPTDQIPATRTSTASATVAAPRSRAARGSAAAMLPPAPVVAPAPADIAPVAALAPAAATHTSIGPAAVAPIEELVEPTTIVAAPAAASAVAASPAAVAATPIAETVEAAGDVAATPEPPCAAGSIEHHVGQGANGDMVVAFNAAPGDTPFDKVEIYTLAGDHEENTPIGTNIAAGQSPPIHLGPGETLVYYITYSRGGVECKSAFFST